MAKDKKHWALKALKLLLFLSCLIALIIAAFFFLPWKNWTQNQIETILKEQGFENPKVHLDSITLDTIKLSNITLGQMNSFFLEDLEIHYKPEELLHGRVQNLNLNSLIIYIVHSEKGWKIADVKEVAEAQSEKSIISFIPRTQKMMNDLPFETAHIKDSKIRIKGDVWEVEIPFSSALKDDVSVSVSNIDLKYMDQRVEIDGVDVTAKLVNGLGWKGAWIAKNISTPFSSIFDANGTLILEGETFSLSGKVIEKDKSAIEGNFKISFDLTDPQNMLLALNELLMPWGDGRLLVKNISIPVFEEKDLTFPIQAQNVSIDDLMRFMTGEYVKASGSISGSLPVILNRNGRVSFGNGILKANSDGVLSIPPALITGKGKQIEMTRDILNNFHYDDLTIRVKKEKRENITIVLALKGNNPDMFNGRDVHLNVNLGGDVMDFIRSNVMMIMQPETLLNQEPK